MLMEKRRKIHLMSQIIDSSTPALFYGRKTPKGNQGCILLNENSFDLLPSEHAYRGFDIYSFVDYL